MQAISQAVAKPNSYARPTAKRGLKASAAMKSASPSDEKREEEDVQAGKKRKRGSLYDAREFPDSDVEEMQRAAGDYARPSRFGRDVKTPTKGSASSSIRPSKRR